MNVTERESIVIGNVQEMKKLLHSLPISYNGGKQKNFEWITSVIAREAVGCQVAIDGFSGSGIISSFLSCIGLDVFCIDALMSAYCLTTTLAGNPGQQMSQADLDWVASHKCVSGLVYEPETSEWIEEMNGVADAYDGVFTPNEAAWMEWARKKLQAIDVYPSLIGLSALRAVACIQPFGTPSGKSTLAHRIKQREKYGNKCLGHYLNSSNEIEVEKWFRKYVGKFNSAVLQLSSMRKGKAICHRGDIIELISKLDGINIDMAYFDPPYGGCGMRRYMEDYAIHEMIIGADPVDVTDFDSPANHAKSFDKLMDTCEKIPIIFFSYNNKSWATINDIVARIKHRGYMVTVESCDYVHGKTPITDSQNSVIENVIVAKRKGFGQ